MISLNQIVKKKDQEGKNVAVLDHINLHITQGEFISMVGFHKCGKSALIRILSTMDNDYFGSYFFNDIQVNKLGKSERQKFKVENIGLIVRDLNLIEYFTIRENITLPLQYISNSEKENLEIARYWCHRFKINHKKNHLSKRVNPLIKIKASIAQALVLQPKILLADDILKPLNEEERKEIITLLSELNNEGLTILLTSENLNDANLFHRKIFINEGKIFTDYPITHHP